MLGMELDSVREKKERRDSELYTAHLEWEDGNREFKTSELILQEIYDNLEKEEKSIEIEVLEKMTKIKKVGVNTLINKRYSNY